jgi:hypothetical protein
MMLSEEASSSIHRAAEKAILGNPEGIKRAGLLDSGVPPHRRPLRRPRVLAGYPALFSSSPRRLTR